MIDDKDSCRHAGACYTFLTISAALLPHRLRLFVVNLTIAGVYFGVAKASLLLASLNPSASPVWPTAGLALAALLLLGRKYAPAILVGAFVVNLSNGSSVAASLVFGAGNTLEALAGFYLVDRFAGRTKAFESVQGVILFSLFAAFLSPVVAATFGLGGVLLDGTATLTDAAAVWVTWWLGDMVGIIVVTPLVVLWTTDAHSNCSHAKAFEACFVLLFLVLVSIAVFTPMRQPLGHLCLLPILWTAIRFVPRDTALAVALTSALAIAGTVKGWGPFALESTNASLLFLQAFMAMCSFTGMTLSAAILERRLSELILERNVDERTTELRHAVERDRASAELLRVIMDHMTVATIAVDAQLRVVHMNDHFRTLFNVHIPTGPFATLSDVLADVRLRFREPHETIDNLLRILTERRKTLDRELALANGATVYCDYIPIADGTMHRGHLFLFRDRKEL